MNTAEATIGKHRKRTSKLYGRITMCGESEWKKLLVSKDKVLRGGDLCIVYYYDKEQNIKFIDGGYFYFPPDCTSEEEICIHIQDPDPSGCEKCDPEQTWGTLVEFLSNNNCESITVYDNYPTYWDTLNAWRNKVFEEEGE